MAAACYLALRSNVEENSVEQLAVSIRRRNPVDLQYRCRLSHNSRVLNILL